MKTFIFLLSLGLTQNVFADCKNFIAQSEIVKALAFTPNAGSKKCGATDPCICFDGVDWEIAKFSNGKLEIDPIKKAQKDARIALELSEKQKEKEKIDALMVKLKTDKITLEEIQQLLKYKL